jgi:hypothetical protein
LLMKTCEGMGRGFSFIWCNSPQWVMASSFTRFLDYTQWRTTVGRTPLDEWSARRRDLYLTTHNTQNRRSSMLPVGFEPAISAGELPQTARPLGPVVEVLPPLIFELDISSCYRAAVNFEKFALISPNWYQLYYLCIYKKLSFHV